MDRSIILMFWPRAGRAWCSSNIVLCTMDWNAKLQRFGSSYIRPWRTARRRNNNQKSTKHADGTISKIITRAALTRKLWPHTSCHFCTGSVAMNTFGQSANCSRNVVFPLPTLPSMNTVYGGRCWCPFMAANVVSFLLVPCLAKDEDRVRLVRWFELLLLQKRDDSGTRRGRGERRETGDARRNNDGNGPQRLRRNKELITF